MITLIILASVSLSIALTWETPIDERLNFKPFNCPPCLSVWISIILLIIGGYDIFTIFVGGILPYIVTTLILWTLEK